MKGRTQISVAEAVAAIRADLPKDVAEVFAGQVRRGDLIPERDAAGELSYRIPDQGELPLVVTGGDQ